MAASGSKKVVIAAFAGNALIAMTKFAAAAVTGASAMFSEAVHSLVDTGNQVLLLHGMKRAARPADEDHPFGYSREIYFWSFVVAVLIFSIGAGVSLYEGVKRIMHPSPIEHAFVNYIVLGAAFVFEAGSWWVAFREFRGLKGSRGYFEAVRISKDPVLFTVLFEDSAALLGIIVAFAGIALGQATGQEWMDGAASVLIGVILALVSVFLAYECKGLLVGEGASRQVVESIRALIGEHAGKVSINELLTMHLGPDDVLVNMSLDFDDGLSAADVEALVSELERKIKDTHGQVTRVFIEAQSFTAHARR